MWELDHKEGQAPKNWSYWIVVLEKTLESLLDWKIKLVNPKWKQPWIFIGKTGAKAEAACAKAKAEPALQEEPLLTEPLGNPYNERLFISRRKEAL